MNSLLDAASRSRLSQPGALAVTAEALMEKQYRLIFKGELLAGSNPTEIRQRASQRLGASPAQISRPFGGQAVTLKRGLRIDAAARYARELRLLGMRMHVELDARHRHRHRKSRAVREALQDCIFRRAGTGRSA